MKFSPQIYPDLHHLHSHLHAQNSPFNPAHHHNMQDFGILEVDLKILDLDLRFIGGLGPSPIELGLSPIGLGASLPLYFKSNSKSPSANFWTSEFSVSVELQSPYLELGTWMLEEY